MKKYLDLCESIGIKMSLMDIASVKSIISNLESSEITNEEDSFAVLARDLSRIYVGRAGETVDSRKKILINTIDSLITPLKKLKPSIILRIILDYFDLSTRSAIDGFKPVEDRILYGKTLAIEYDKFYLKWNSQLGKTDIFNCGLSIQDACKTLFELLSALYCTLWGDLMMVNKYRFDALTRLERATIQLHNQAEINKITENITNDGNEVREQLLTRGAIKNSYKDGLRNLDPAKWDYLFENEKNNGLHVARRKNLRNKASYSMFALHGWLLQEGYFQQKDLNRICDVGNRFTEFGKDIASLADID